MSIKVTKNNLLLKGKARMKRVPFSAFKYFSNFNFHSA